MPLSLSIKITKYNYAILKPLYIFFKRTLRMRTFFIYVIVLATFMPISTISASEGIAKKHKLYAGTKASIQWKRIFSSQRRLHQYNLDSLSPNELNSLKRYLISHAADSEQPVVPGL